MSEKMGKIVQIALCGDEAGHILYALTEDGGVWWKSDIGLHWKKEPLTTSQVED